MTDENKSVHVHMAESFKVSVVRGQPEWAVLHVFSAETGEEFRFGIHRDDLAGLAERLRLDAMLLKA